MDSQGKLIYSATEAVRAEGEATVMGVDMDGHVVMYAREVPGKSGLVAVPVPAAVVKAGGEEPAAGDVIGVDPSGHPVYSGTPREVAELRGIDLKQVEHAAGDGGVAVAAGDVTLE